MNATIYGVPLKVTQMIAKESIGQVVKERFIKLVKNSWQLDEKFKNYINENTVNAERVEDYSYIINFSFLGTETHSETETTFTGYQANQVYNDYQIKPTYQTSSKSVTETNKYHHSLISGIIPSDRDKNLMEITEVDDIDPEDGEFVNDERKVLDFIISEKKNWIKNFYGVKNVDNIKIESIEVIYHSVFSVKFEYEGEDYSLDDILPSQAGEYVLNIDDSEQWPVTKKYQEKIDNYYKKLDTLKKTNIAVYVSIPFMFAGFIMRSLSSGTMGIIFMLIISAAIIAIEIVSQRKEFKKYSQMSFNTDSEYQFDKLIKKRYTTAFITNIICIALSVFAVVAGLISIL
ncbi:MAG: hypothetical protein IJ811_00590 [Clostridia bacterium]|nr:hypothetical protein [Clostridia bacterium]